MTTTQSYPNAIVFARVEKIMSWCDQPSLPSSTDFLMTYLAELKQWKVRERRKAIDQKKLKSKL